MDRWDLLPITMTGRHVWRHPDIVIFEKDKRLNMVEYYCAHESDINH